MRIAVSGTHCTGKSTLIDEFLRTHADFAHEREPYTVLVEDFRRGVSAEPVDDFYRQLDFNVERLRQHARGDRDTEIAQRQQLSELLFVQSRFIGS